MLGANTMGICCAAAAMRARPASSKPVVPITSGTPGRDTGVEIAEGGFGTGEVDQGLRALQGGDRLIGDAHPAGRAPGSAGILPHQRAAGTVNGGMQRAARVGRHRFEQRTPHAAGHAGNGNLHAHGRTPRRIDSTFSSTISQRPSALGHAQLLDDGIAVAVGTVKLLEGHRGRAVVRPLNRRANRF